MSQIDLLVVIKQDKQTDKYPLTVVYIFFFAREKLQNK